MPQVRNTYASNKKYKSVKKEIQMLPNLISKKTLKTLDGPLADRVQGKTKELTKAG